MDLSGQDIREMLEKAIDGVYPNGTGYPGGLVQMSGIKVEYLISNYPGPKVQKIRTLCPNRYTTCEEDEDWCDLKDETVYKVALPRYVILQKVMLFFILICILIAFWLIIMTGKISI